MRLTAVTIFALAASAFASQDRMARTLAKRIPAAGGPTDVEILNFALTLEYLERDFYAKGLATFSRKDFKKAGYSSKVYDRFVAIASQEKTHVAFLAGALGSAGVGECKYEFNVKNVAGFLATSLVLEGVGTSAYLGAAPDITEAAYLADAGAILTVEARHSSYLNELNGISGFPNAYDAALTYSEVYTLAAGFIVPGSCGTSGTLPAGIHAYPHLKIKDVPRAGQNLGTHFPLTAGVTKYYAAFINGLTTTFVAVDDSNGVVKVPKGLTGATYLIISKSATELGDENIVAGPAVLLL